GPLFFGQTLLIKVKDAQKVKTSLDQAVKSLVLQSGNAMSIKKKVYRGMDVREIHVRQQGFIFVPTYAVCKDWLVVGFYPQSVQGFVLRSRGELPTWKPDAALQASLARLPKEFVFVSVTDPRPTVQQVLGVAPLIAEAINSFSSETYLDVGTLPNPHQAVQHLFPT